MTGRPEHTDWLADSGDRLTTADGKEVQVWEFRHQADESILSSWASHFRNHYCSDAEIDLLRASRPRRDYLVDIKFPSRNSRLGPSIRAGDFGEILVADFLEWLLDYWVPRIRWSSKVVRDESPKGSDVIGFHFENADCSSEPNDVMFVFEAKTKFSGSRGNKLQTAINDSAKDHIRIDESLNFIKQKFIDKSNHEEANKIERFQNPVDDPYVEKYGAAAIISEEFYDEDELVTSDCNSIPQSSTVIAHPNRDNLTLVVIKGGNMMTLVHDLYQRAADEA